MEKFQIKGSPSKGVKGHINCSGAKNAALPLMASSILFDDTVTLTNVPIGANDIQTMIILLKSLGSIINLKNNKLIIDNSKQNKKFASYSLVKTMRAGILVLGPLLAKFGNAKVSLPGGCAIGTRPVDIHLNALSKLGV